MRLITLGSLATSTLLAGCMGSGGGYGVDLRYRNYDYNRPDPSYGL